MLNDTKLRPFDIIVVDIFKLECLSLADTTALAYYLYYFSLSTQS